MKTCLLTAVWGDCSPAVLRESVRRNAPGLDLVTIRGATTRPGWKDRWRWYAEFLAGQGAGYDLVMTVDARDTVVQRDPGQLARDVLGDPSRVLVTAEPITVCQQPWNMTERDKWQADRLPVYRPEARVINGGFAAGRPNVLRWFCLARWCLDFAHQASDQAGVTALADWLKGWPSLVVSTHADGLVGHGFHWQQPGFDPARFAIFHQWDRTPWANAVRKAYPAGSTV